MFLSMSQLTFCWFKVKADMAIQSLISNPPPFFCVGVKGNVQGNLFKVITKDDTHYYIQASSKAERAEWIEAIKKLT